MHEETQTRLEFEVEKILSELLEEWSMSDKATPSKVQSCYLLSRHDLSICVVSWLRTRKDIHDSNDGMVDR